MFKGSLLLLPNVLDPEASDLLSLPPAVAHAVQKIDGLIAESEKGGRYFLRRFSFPAPKTFRDIPIRLLNEHTTEKELDALLELLLKGEQWGLVSDCGLPCLADPGAKLVFQARKHGVNIEAFPGPSSIVLALMLSGLSAQSFAFHGYLEREPEKLSVQIKKLQRRASEEKATQVFIETPYRNQKLLQFLIEHLQDQTMLCVAWDLMLPSQEVVCLSIAAWKKQPLPPINKKPAVFCFSNGA
jgi:16S rRNA (cytidine1402-2'-O)-methyltransferase